MARVLWGLLFAFVATVVAARLAFEFTAPEFSGQVNEPWAQSRMEFVSWNNEQWTAWVRDEIFEQTPENTVDWQAKVEGESFVLAHRGNWSGSTESANAIRYRDWSGQNRLRTLAQLGR